MAQLLSTAFRNLSTIEETVWISERLCATDIRKHMNFSMSQVAR